MRFKKIIEWTIIGILCLFILVIVSPSLPTKRFLLSFIVTSGSMAPTVPAGSLVLVHPATARTAQVGDIIAFTLPDNPKTTVLHRVNTISSSPLTYHTKGDNNNAADTWTVPASSVIGTYIYGIPAVGYAAAFIRTKLGFGLLIGIPVLYLIYTQIRLIIDGIEEEMQKRAKKRLTESPLTQTNILPLFVAGFLVGSITALGIRNIKALFSAQATIQGINISSEIGVTPTPTPTPTPHEETPTPTPASPSQGGPICPQGTIIQENFLNSHTTVTSVASTGNNTIDGSTGGGSTSVTTGDASASAIVITTGGGNTIHCIQNNFSTP